MTEFDARTLASIIDACNDAVVTKTLDGRITSWNPAAEWMFGYPASEMIDRSIVVLFPPDRLDEEADFQRRIQSGQRVEHFETVRLRKDGGPIDVSITLSPIVDADGRIVGISKIVRDITGLKQSEASLRLQREVLRITLSSIGDAVIATDTDARVTFFNAEAERVTGWPSGEALGRRLEDVFVIVNEETGRPAQNPVFRVLREGVIVGLANHSVLVARDGRRIPIDDSAAPIRDETTGVFGGVLVFRDVTERRQSELGLRRLAAIVASSDDAIVGKTPEGVITTWNAGAERMFGYRAEEVIGRRITVLFPPDRIDEEEELLARVGRGERVEHFDTVRVRKDGRHLHMSVTLSAIRDADGTMLGISKIARDVTERVELALREREAMRAVEEASRLKDEFLATLSHELRTPLNAVFGWIRMLRGGGLDGATAGRGLEVIERSARTLLDLITDLMDISRIVGGRMRLTFTPTDLRQVARAAVEALRPTAVAKQQSLELVADESVSPVLGDARRLQQVVSNLVSNAVKFTPSRGRVTVSVRRVASHVVLAVSDTGIGVDAEVLPYVFDRFRQGDSSMTRGYGGLGLGLAIVRHLVELHGGSVSAASDGPGRGATFTVSLPVAAVAPVAEAPQESLLTALPALRGVRVLVVDDDEDARDLIGEILLRSGAVAFTAGSAAEGVSLLLSERPDVLITDLGMPGEDGFALVRRIRGLSDGELARIPVLALTAYARAEDRDRVLSEGFQAYLPKPVEPAALARAVVSLVPDRDRT